MTLGAVRVQDTRCSLGRTGARPHRNEDVGGCPTTAPEGRSGGHRR